jgi:hypothetical protein
VRLLVVLLVLELMAIQYSRNSPLAEAASHGQVVTAKHYMPGIMRSVALKRGLWDTRQDVSGYASVPDCSLIGRVAVAIFRNPRTQRWERAERLLVVDCSAPRDSARHIRSGLGIETDYATAQRHGFDWNGWRGEGKTQAIILRFER